MPVYLERAPSNRELLPYARVSCSSSPHSRNWLDIGIVNNMPDAALHATERQFVTLLDSAAGDLLVRVSFYALPELTRSGYLSAADLWDRRLDGLIVTGAEPQSLKLTDEPYWPSLTRLIEWAGHNTHGAIWSCLAAHAAVLYLDGIERRRLRNKRFGLFESAPVSAHELTIGIPPSVRMPHSRWNDLPESELRECGYRVLTRSEDAGVDTFVKQQTSLFVFFQGHPEYEAGTLLLEYRRDLGRYLKGETDVCPALPRNYFDAEAASRLAALERRALQGRREQLLAEFPMAALKQNLTNAWQPAAIRMYANWLQYLAFVKERRFLGRLGSLEQRSGAGARAVAWMP
jgi:homoserine O-succinyltransferase/O-acetyltransferase